MTSGRQGHVGQTTEAVHIIIESTPTLEEELEDTTGLLVDETTDTLYTTTASETADSGLGDTLNVVTQNLAMALRTTLPETLATCSVSSQLLEESE